MIFLSKATTSFIEYSYDDIEGKFIYAYLLGLTGKYDKALKYYHELFEIIPENSQLAKELTDIYYILDDNRAPCAVDV